MPTVSDLGQRLKARYPGKYDDLSDAEAGARLKERYPGSYDDFSDSASVPMAMTEQYNPLSSALTGLRGRGLEALPGIGGFVGGFAGPPGAAIGGGVGEALRESAIGQPLSPRDIGLRGGEQAAYQVAGGLAAKGAIRLARPLMRKAIGVLPSLAERFGMTLDEVAEKFAKMRLGATPASRQAAKQMGTAARIGRSATLAAVPGTRGAAALSRVVISDAERALRRPLTMVERRALIRQVEAEADAILTARTRGVVPKTAPRTPAQPASKVLNQYGQPAIPTQGPGPRIPSRYTALEMEQIKEVAAKRARAAYKAQKEGLSVAADPEFDKQIAAGARRQLAKVPGVGEYNARIRDAMVAEQAIRRSLNRPGEWMVPHIGPVGLGFKVPPGKLSGAALLLTSKKFQALAKQSPRALAEIYRQLIYTDQPDVTATGR